MWWIQTIIALIFATIPFIGDYNRYLGYVVMTLALSLLDVVHEKRGWKANQTTALAGLMLRIVVYTIASSIHLTNPTTDRFFVTGLISLFIGQMVADATVFSLLKRYLPGIGFVGRNLLSNLVGLTVFVLRTGGNPTQLMTSWGIRIGASMGIAWVLKKLLPFFVILCLASPVRAAEFKPTYSLRLMDDHYEGFLTLRYGRVYAQNLTLLDPGTNLPWNTKTTVGLDVFKSKWFTLSAIGQYQTWEVWKPRVNWERPEAWRYGVEVRGG